MKESNVEGIAIHNGLELCGGDSNIAAEALTEESAGVVLSPEIGSNVSSADRLLVQGRQHMVLRYGKKRDGSAGSEAHRMHRSFLGGNREALQLVPADCAGVRTANSKEVEL